MRTCLEIYSMDGINKENGRHQMELRSDYQRTKQYSVTHKDALATGDMQGKGTGSAGHSHWLPNCTSQMGVYNFSNFDTAISFGAGNDADNNARNEAITRSLYGPMNRYDATIVDTSMNVAEGQYVIK